MSSSSNFDLQHPNTPLISVDNNDEVFTTINGHAAQFVPCTPNHHPNHLQLCQQRTPIPDTPEYMTTEDRGQSDIFHPYDIPNPSSSPSFNKLINISTVADGLQNLTLHPHPQCNEWPTGCLVCGKTLDQIIENTVAEFFNQTSQTGETVRDRQIKRKAFKDGVLSGVFKFLPRECRRLSPVTA